MSKENLHFDDQSKHIDSLFFIAVFLKKIENMFSMFLSSYRNTRESLGEQEKSVYIAMYVVDTLAHSISHSSKLPLLFL